MKDQILSLLKKHPSLNISENTERVADLLVIYLSEWKKWNRKINLTSENQEQAILEKHIFESLQYGCALEPLEKEASGAVMDIGSGAGFPGIPLKIAFPRFSFVLVESQRKRASFLQNTIRAMQLEAIEVVHGRAEELGDPYLSQFDYVVSRSVGEQCLRIAAPFLKDRGRMIMRKEPEAFSEGTEELSPYRIQAQFPVTGLTGTPSKLMVFEKCST